MVADDDDAMLELLVTRLELGGYHTFTARDGFKALESIYSVRPNGVVLDIGMPRMDGFGVLSALQQNMKFRDTPVLVLTARNATDDIRRAISLGAKDYLTKPFDDKLLLARVARLTRPRSRDHRTIFVD
ncbi:MAG TPA: response regulator [Caulobacteraceae bacterium]|nr:response regulator [Caulobacteraceae bacterium]